MQTIFIEYRIHETTKSGFLQDIPFVLSALKDEQITGYKLLEATDQPHLYVETFEIGSINTYKKWKQMLISSDPDLPWEPVMKYIVGGRKKFNMWSFSPIPLVTNPPIL
jgi:hypothetical protein